jgi:protein SCO1
MMKKRLLILALSVVAGLAVAFLAVQVQKRPPGKIADENALIAVTDDAFGGPFTLTDHNGKRVSEKDFTGKYRLIYFGFTYCPAICPTELSKITAALNTLGDKGKDIQPLFITIDPERDTPEKMKSYVSLFHPKLIGLSGSPDEIKSVLKGYKIYAAKRQDESMSDYTMDHSSYIYLIAPDDRLLHIFKMEDKADVMADIIARWLAQPKQ